MWKILWNHYVGEHAAPRRAAPSHYTHASHTNGGAGGIRRGPSPARVVNLDDITTIPMSMLDRRITALPSAKTEDDNRAIRFALALG